MHRILPISILILSGTVFFSVLGTTYANSQQHVSELFTFVILKKLLMAQQASSPSQRVLAETTQPTTKERIMQGINTYRVTQGLETVQTSVETCAFAKIRAKEIAQTFTHEGFQNRIDQKNLPYQIWTRATENIAMTTNASEVVRLWISSPRHAANMRKDTPFVCVEQYGNYFAYEGMRP